MKVLPVTLVVPTHNRVQKLTRLLKSVSRLNPKPSEIIIVNDGSSDGTSRLLGKWEKLENHSSRQVINISKSKGPAFARNQGIISSNNEIIAFTDDDVVVTKSWIEFISKKLRGRNKNGSKLCGIGGKVFPLNNDILSQYYSEHRILDPPRLLQYLVTVNCSFTKEHLLKVGLFDSNFNKAGGEDTDLSLKLHKLGYKFAREDQAILYHDFSSNFYDFCKLWIRYGKGTKLAIKNNK